ncbi:DUF397 domain-containing protein [Streptomyces bohaiensis]|uniref:DUF397 domain-containing protein n=1 Tax=Streptomyces bohaiensis TaxID=1431344 RepID=A0ABX1C7K5_9ACTN|nr:DUF397 domain-containing protein [Streptomyces bohaiensis]NJQ15141.1 DUF397 domain-containing protein [Streptomyces bohaiensis]
MFHASVGWFSSSYSGNGGDCVEVTAGLVATHGTVPVRDSKRPAGPALAVPGAAFASFVNGIKSSTIQG